MTSLILPRILAPAREEGPRETRWPAQRSANAAASAASAVLLADVCPHAKFQIFAPERSLAPSRPPAAPPPRSSPSDLSPLSRTSIRGRQVLPVGGSGKWSIYIPPQCVGRDSATKAIRLQVPAGPTGVPQPPAANGPLRAGKVNSGPQSGNARAIPLPTKYFARPLNPT